MEWFVNFLCSRPAVSALNASDRIDFNERFNWLKPDDMIDAYDEALHRGLPYPILTVAEYLSLNEEGFGWGRAYRSAGYFSCIALWWVLSLDGISGRDPLTFPAVWCVKRNPFLSGTISLLQICKCLGNHLKNKVSKKLFFFRLLLWRNFLALTDIRRLNDPNNTAVKVESLDDGGLSGRALSKGKCIGGSSLNLHFVLVVMKGRRRRRFSHTTRVQKSKEISLLS